MSDATEADKGGIWDRLRSRKVVQWGLAYAAGAWGLLQGVGFTADAFHWPDAIKQVALLLLLLGLPIVLVVAWYHGDRGEQRVTGAELAILTLLFLVGGGLFWRFEHSRPPSPTAAPTAESTPGKKGPTSSAASVDPRPSIAVLPFDNRSRLEDDAFFVDGIHDDILMQLSKVSALRVISRTSVEQYRDTKLSTRAIAEQLGVKTILEGGVQRAGDRVHINVQLIDASTDAHIWADSYDRKLTVTEVFAIQSEVANTIASALRIALTPAEQARARIMPTRDLTAWEAYQRGTGAMENRTSAGLAEAEGHFRKAVALDPLFALAWVGLADTLILQVGNTGRPRDAGLDEAKQAVDRALELDANLAEAWASSGHFQLMHQRLDLAEPLLRRAIELNRNYAPAYHWLGITIAARDRREERLAMLEHAVVLDPRSAVINLSLGAARRGVSRFDEALAAYRQAIEIDATMALGYLNIGELYAHVLGQYDVALPWYEKAASLDPGNPHLPVVVGEAYWEIGDDAEAARWLARAMALADGTTDTHELAMFLKLSVGDMASARRHAERAAELDPWNMLYIRDFDLRNGDYATARARYARAFPNLFATDQPKFEKSIDYGAAIELALVLKGTGELERARVLLDRAEAYMQTVAGIGNRRFYVLAIHAARGDTARVMATLREIARGGPQSRWRYYRDFAPELASIRNDAEFKALFADIERAMASQRAALAKRPKDAPLENRVIVAPGPAASGPVRSPLPTSRHS